MTDFPDYITHYREKKFGKERMFVPGRYNEASKQTWTPLKESSPVDSRHILEIAEERNCQFPEGYCTFMETLGPGLWAGMGIPQPEDTHAFDQATGAMQGFVTVACNVNGMGDYLAFNPKEGEKIYFCGHDPFGYAVAGNSFEEVITKVTEAALAEPNNGVSKFFEGLPFVEVTVDDVEVEAMSAAPKSSAAGSGSSKPWWRFW